MSSFKSREQANAEAMGTFIGGAIALALKLTILCFVYSPFVFVFGVVFYITYKINELHWIASGILGLMAVACLWFVVAFIHVAERDLRDHKNIFWIPLALVNVALIAGMPFLIGMIFGVNLVGADTASLFEKILAGGFGGCLLAVPAYISVRNTLQTDR